MKITVAGLIRTASKGVAFVALVLSTGIVRGQDVVKDIDGNVYHTVTIGTQVWMVENLKTSRFNDGTAIPQVTDDAAWNKLTTPGYCWYGNDSARNNACGPLYNWYAVGSGKLAPKGWHVPTDAEWKTLITFLGGEKTAGGKMKERGEEHWAEPNNDADNSSGFTALPGSLRSFDGRFFERRVSFGNWWSSTEINKEVAWHRSLSNTEVSVFRGGFPKQDGYSVRCIKNN